MAQSSQADPEWLALRKHHQQELQTWLMNVEAIRREQQRRFDVDQAALLARHSEEERSYWRRREQEPSSTPRPIPAQPQPTATQAPARQPSAQQKNSLVRARPLRHESSTKHSRGRKADTRPTVASSGVQRPSEKMPKPMLQSLQSYQSNAQASMEAMRRAQLAQGASSDKQPTASQRQTVAQNKSVVINLCESDDDEMLVEVSKLTYQESLKQTNVQALSRSGVPTTKLQPFDQTSQGPLLLSGSLSIKQERAEMVGQVQSQSDLQSSRLAHDNGSTFTSKPGPAELYNGQQINSPTASNARSSTNSCQAASADQLHRYNHANFQPASSTTSSPEDQVTEKPNSILHPSVSGRINLSKVDAEKHGSSDPLPQQSQRSTGNLTGHGPWQGRHATGSSIAHDQLIRVGDDDDGDIDMEDVPLACLDIPAALKRIGRLAPKKMGSDVDLAKPAAIKPSRSNKIVKQPYLPSPSPSIVSAPTTPMSEATDLLERFKRPCLLSASRCPPGSSTPVPESRASTCTLPRLVPYATQRQASVASHASNISNLNRKRKYMDLSDDEQSNYSPSEVSAVNRRKPTNPLDSHSMRPVTPVQPLHKPNGAPPALPSASPLPPAGIKTNGFGFRTKGTPAASTRPTTPPRMPPTKVKPATPTTPTRSLSNAREKALSTPPSKRKAAVRAQTEIQKISEAEEVFHTEDVVLQASAKEMRRKGSNTAELDTRLRSMSITPVPMGTRLGTTKGPFTANAHIRVDDSSVAVETEDSVCATNSGSRKTASGHRRTFRTRNIDEIIGGDNDEDTDLLEDLDISKFTHVNGIILQAGQERRLMDTKTKAIRRREL